MFLLTVTAILAAGVAGFVTACVAYILFSFWRSEHLLPARLGRRRSALIVLRPPHARRVRPATAHGARGRLRLHPVHVR